MQSKASTVDEYLASLPGDRRAAIEAVRAVFLKNMDKALVECMSYGMIGYAVPHRVYPAGYHCDPTKPLPFAGIASQKNHMSVYLMCVYGNAQVEAKFRKAWAATGKKLDMGKGCVRFKRVEDLALDVIAETLRAVSVKAFITQYEGTLARTDGSRPKSRIKTAASKKAPRSTKPTKAALERTRGATKSRVKST